MIEDSSYPSPSDETNAQQESNSQKAMPKISFPEITGTNHPQTIRVLVQLKNKNITVLIDDGSTHNFIDQAIVTEHRLPMIQDKKF